jgi:ribosomal protein L40E
MGRHGSNWQHEQSGWLKNKDRKERRAQSGTLVDSQVQIMLDRIDEIDHYTTLEVDVDRLIRERDQALIALTWIYFKRANEVLHVRRADISYDNINLSVTFTISKKAKTYKICPRCSDKNAKRAKYCKKCGENIETAAKQTEPNEMTVTKNKNLKYPFCKYVIKWVESLKEMQVATDIFIFPPFKQFGGFNFGKDKDRKAHHYLTVQRFNQILQRLDPTMTSSFFRYGHTEKLLRAGYTPYDLKEIGDWESSHMPEIYAKRKGFTASQKKFAEDIRTT